MKEKAEIKKIGVKTEKMKIKEKVKVRPKQ